MCPVVFAGIAMILFFLFPGLVAALLPGPLL
jgi:hypothetical protein